eukprot:Skav206921  [mRNA]  locus=scaffold808:857596:859406:+ [translate_table: standard]
MDEAAAWRGLDDPRTYDEWSSLGFNIGDTYDYRLGARRPVVEGEILYPVVSAISMGWRWALFLANECVASIARESSRGPRAELRERHPTPQLWDHHTLSSTYVDNVTVIGQDFDQVAQKCEPIDQSVRETGMPVALLRHCRAWAVEAQEVAKESPGEPVGAGVAVHQRGGNFMAY